MHEYLHDDNNNIPWWREVMYTIGEFVWPEYPIAPEVRPLLATAYSLAAVMLLLMCITS